MPNASIKGDLHAVSDFFSRMINCSLSNSEKKCSVGLFFLIFFAPETMRLGPSGAKRPERGTSPFIILNSLFSLRVFRNQLLSYRKTSPLITFPCMFFFVINCHHANKHIHPDVRETRKLRARGAALWKVICVYGHSSKSFWPPQGSIFFRTALIMIN